MLDFNSYFANEPSSGDLLENQMLAYKNMLEQLNTEILKSSNLRNIGSKDIGTFIQDFDEIIEYVINVDKRRLHGIIRSEEGLCTLLTDAINEFNVALDLLDRVNPPDVNLSTFSEGRSNFYNRLNKCKNCIGKALRLFLI